MRAYEAGSSGYEDSHLPTPRYVKPAATNISLGRKFLPSINSGRRITDASSDHEACKNSSHSVTSTSASTLVASSLRLSQYSIARSGLLRLQTSLLTGS